MYSRLDIASVITQQTLEIRDTRKLTYAIASFLLQNKHTNDLDSIMREVMAYRAIHGYIEATVTSAYPIDTATKKTIRSLIKQRFPDAKSYVLNENIDDKVIGGLRIECCGEELDLTVRSKLNKFKRLTVLDEG